MDQCDELAESSFGLAGILQRRIFEEAENTEQDNDRGVGNFFRFVAGRRYGPDGGLHPRHTLHRRQRRKPGVSSVFR